MIQPSDLGLSESQLANARGIIAAVKADARFKADPQKAAVIAIETALTESGMRMIASANVPESQKYPFERLTWTSDGLGHDHASMGMFQQQTGYAWTPAGFGQNMNQTTMDSPNGWGTPSELMNAELSTVKFLDALANVDWQGQTNWLAAQAVQRSAFPDGSNYRQQDALAQRIVGVLWGAPTPSPVEDDVLPELIQYSGRGPSANDHLKHLDAVYVHFDRVCQRHVVNPAERDDLLKTYGQAKVHVVDHSRGYYGPVVGIDPEAS